MKKKNEYPFEVWHHVGTPQEERMASAKTRAEAEKFADIYRPITAGYSKRKWHGRITIRMAKLTP